MIRAPHQDEPRIGQCRRGGWVTRASRAAPDDDTNASFPTKSQSLPRRARNCSEWPDKLIRMEQHHCATRRSALRFKPRHRSLIRAPSVPNAFSARARHMPERVAQCKVVGFDFRLKRIGDFVMAERRR